MYCSNGSSMATLLQQKNFMKTLSNNGGTTSGGNTGSVVVDGPSPMSNGTISNHSSTLEVPTTTGTLTSNSYNSNPFNGYQQQHSHNMLHQQQQQHHLPHHSLNRIHSSTTTYNNTAAGASNITSSTSSIHNFYHSANHNNLTSEEEQQLLDDCIEEDPVDDDEAALMAVQKQQTAEEQEPEPEIDIVINNVVCSFSVRCHLNLREIALNGFNVEFRRENGMVTMKLRRPYTTASIWSSGRITCTGATSEDQAKVAARRYARCLQKLGFNARLHNFRVVNVLGTCSMPWAIKITNFSEKHRQNASYEPELHPGVTYKLKSPKATLKIFSTGSITVTAPSVSHVQQAIEHIFPLVYEFRKKRTPEEEEKRRKHLEQISIKRPFGKVANDPFDDIMVVSDTEPVEEEEEEF